MKTTWIILIVFFLINLSGCDESLLEQNNPNAFTADTYFKNPEQLTTATNGVYSTLLGASLCGRWYQFLSDGRADEHSVGGVVEFSVFSLFYGTYDNSNYAINTVWKGLYTTIQRANAVIQYGSEMHDIDPVLQNQRISEAKFLRAWAYYHLLAHWGRIPLYTEVATSPEPHPLAEEAAVYALLETDLTDIQDHLDWTYSGIDAGRAGKGAAKLLLARVLMHQGKYAEAKTVLEDIYTNSPFRLVDNYSDNFREETEYNEASIFEISFAGEGFSWDEYGNSMNQRSTMMFQDYSPVGWRNCIPSDKLLNNFEHPEKGDEKEDPRLHESVYFTGDTFGSPQNPVVLTEWMQGGRYSIFHDDTLKASWKKYSPMYKLNPGGYYASNINYRNMRFAEVLIKLAECENELENSNASRARAMRYLNEIRARASVDMPPYPTANYPCDSYDEMMRAIMHESLVEFSNEKLRVLELARWRKNSKFSVLNPEPIYYIAEDSDKALLILPNEETNHNYNID